MIVFCALTLTRAKGEHCDRREREKFNPNKCNTFELFCGFAETYLANIYSGNGVVFPTTAAKNVKQNRRRPPLEPVFALNQNS